MLCCHYCQIKPWLSVHNRQSPECMTYKKIFLTWYLIFVLRTFLNDNHFQIIFKSHQGQLLTCFSHWRSLTSWLVFSSGMEHYLNCPCHMTTVSFYKQLINQLFISSLTCYQSINESCFKCVYFRVCSTVCLVLCSGTVCSSSMKFFIVVQCV